MYIFYFLFTYLKVVPKMCMTREDYEYKHNFLNPFSPILKEIQDHEIFMSRFK